VGETSGRNLKGQDKINNNHNTTYNHYYSINLKPKRSKQMHQLITVAYLIIIRMEKINTENIQKYLQPGKSGGYKKSLHFTKN
jgi:hypothetical protein